MHCWLCQIVMLGQAFGERRVVSICIDVSVDFLVVKFYWLTECRMNFIRSRSWFRVAHGLVWLSEGLLYQKNTWKNPSLQRTGWHQDQKDAKKCRAYFGIKTFGSSGRSARQELFGVIVCWRGLYSVDVKAWDWGLQRHLRSQVQLPIQPPCSKRLQNATAFLLSQVLDFQTSLPKPMVLGPG